MCLYCEKAGWTFKDNEEKAKAKVHVQIAIDSHEALAFRAKTSGSARHEFPALIAELARRLGLLR